MACTWGSTEVKILCKYTYQPQRADASIGEIKLLPKYGDLTAITTALQQGGRTRKRVKWTGYVSAIADYNTLHTDWLAGTTRTFTDPDAETLSSKIISLSEPRYTQADYIEYDIELIEV
jgi:hypothetical protein